MLESSSQHVDSSLEIDQDLLKKEALDEEIWEAARKLRAESPFIFQLKTREGAALIYKHEIN